MRHNWQRLLNQSHANAFRVAAISPQAVESFRRLVAQAANDGITLGEFTYLTEREMKNG